MSLLPPTNSVCFRTSGGADAAIFGDGSFGEEQKDGDGPAEAAPGDAGVVSVGTQTHILQSRGAERVRNSEENVSRSVSLFVCFRPADRNRTTHTRWNNQAGRCAGKRPYRGADDLIAPDTAGPSGPANVIRRDRDGARVTQPCSLWVRGAGTEMFAFRFARCPHGRWRTMIFRHIQKGEVIRGSSPWQRG